MTRTTDPILTSHRGKLVNLYPDGRMTSADGTPVVDEPEKRKPRVSKRWHDPYA